MGQPPTVRETMSHRFSCRTFTGEPLGAPQREQLAAAAAAVVAGPSGCRLRFRLLAAAPGDEQALKRLGTYGTIRGVAAFLVGAAEAGPRYREDFGYGMERLVLQATGLGLGTCWVGGTFTRGTFRQRIGASGTERMPAVTAVGIAPGGAQDGLVRRTIQGSRRKPWDALFHDQEIGRPLTADQAGPWADPLEMVRRAPSASNRQPWRIVRRGGHWDFYLRRTPGYPPRLARILLGVEDLQRVDMGIAMCHFELAARENGLPGHWVDRPPPGALPDPLTEYSISWEE